MSTEAKLTEEELYEKLPTVLIRMCYLYAKEPRGIVESLHIKRATTYARLITDRAKSKILILSEQDNAIHVRDIHGEVVYSKPDCWGTNEWWREVQVCQPGASAFSILHCRNSLESLDIMEVHTDGVRNKQITMSRHFGRTNIAHVLCEGGQSDVAVSKADPHSCYYTLVDCEENFLHVFDSDCNFVRSESFFRCDPDVRTALHRGMFASDGHELWITDSAENDLLFINSRTLTLLTTVRVGDFPVWRLDPLLGPPGMPTIGTLVSQRQVLLRDICCGDDGLVYVLAMVEYLNGIRCTRVCVLNARGEFVRSWEVDLKCSSLIFGPQNRLHLLGFDCIFVCD